MQDDSHSNNLVNSKKKSSEQVLNFYEVYAYHVLLVVLGIVLIGAPLVYSLKIGRSGILSGVVNYSTCGYCYPFNKPFAGSYNGHNYGQNEINDSIPAEPVTI